MLASNVILSRKDKLLAIFFILRLFIFFVVPMDRHRSVEKVRRKYTIGDALATVAAASC